jgi:WD40 repeat protein
MNISNENLENIYSLTKVIGFGSKNNNSISVDKVNGLNAYITGPIINFYDIKKDKQIHFIVNKNNKLYTCLCFSDNGNYLAAAEGNGRNSDIHIYNVKDSNINNNSYLNNIVESESFGNLEFTIKGHKCGIEKIKFFKDDKFLISIGDNEDKAIYIWSMTNPGEKVFATSYKRAIFCFDINSKYLVLGGAQFLKVWTMNEVLNNSGNTKIVMKKDNVELARLKDKIFKCGLIYENKILLLTTDGILAEVNTETRLIGRWMELKVI